MATTTADGTARIGDLGDVTGLLGDDHKSELDDLDLNGHDVLRLAATVGTSTSPGASDEDK
jgi:hypothetical protein